MYDPREKVFWFAVTSRALVFLLQLLFNSICPDHEADAFTSLLNGHELPSVFDRIVDRALGGLARWDSQYYMHIAKYGYTYENTLAFLPLYPLSVRYVAFILQRILVVFDERSAMMIAATLISYACFVKSAVVLYDLGVRVLKNPNVAYKAAILYCVNPASIFFSAMYTESMFAYFTFYAMLKHDETSVFLPIGLSALVRSNGLINVGFPLHAWLRRLLSVDGPRFALACRRRSTDLWPSLKILLVGCLWIINVTFLSLVPFALLQCYNFAIFCASALDTSSMPIDVLEYALENDLTVPGDRDLPWCHGTAPMAYSYIQQKYWNVGFLNYYEFKQLPNFILAFPVLYVLLNYSVEFLIEHKEQLYTLGLARSVEGSKVAAARKYPAEMFVFVAHGLFLTLFCILFVHIQVSTRLLASASPLLYWYCAFEMSFEPKDSNCDEPENLRSRRKVFFMRQKTYTTSDRLILSYFLGYLVLGCFAFSNFLPWT